MVPVRIEANMGDGATPAVAGGGAAWTRRLQVTADLKAAIDDVRSDRSSLGYAMRARVHLIQAACSHANSDLKMAVMKAVDERAPPERVLTISAYRRELAVCLGRRTRGGVMEETNIYGRPESLHGILRYHRAIDGAQLLIDGIPGRAVEVYDELLASSACDSNEAIASWLFGSATAAVELGDHEGAERKLDAAGLAVRHSEFLLFQVRGAARLESSYRAIGLRSEAADWGAYIDRLPCPDATKDYVRARSRMLRSYSRSSVPVL